MNDFDLAGLVSARICHDLASPLGAVVNGAELIAELPPGEAGDELKLVAQSTGRAAALLAFLRLAFGSVGDPDARMPLAELKARAEKVLTSPRITLEWSPDAGIDIAVTLARIAALMMLTARAALPRGGVLKVTTSQTGDLPVTIQATGQHAGLSDDQRGWLTGGTGAPPEPRQGEFALIGLAAARAGARIELTEGAEAVRFTALPA